MSGPDDRRRFLRFVAAGGTAAAVNVASRVALGTVMSYGWSILVAYGCGMVTAWVLSRVFVFERTGRAARHELARFTLVNVLAAGMVWAVSELLERSVFPAIGFDFHTHTVAHVLGVASPVVASYLAHRRFTFAPAPATSTDAPLDGAGHSASDVNQAPGTGGVRAS